MKTAAFAFVLALGVVSSASATPVTYTLNVGAGTLNGNNVTSVAILESGSGLTNLDFAFTLNAVGQTTITHDVPFVPTSTLIVGLDLAGSFPGSVGDGKTHLVFFTNPGFAEGRSGVLFKFIFPHTSHSDLITRLISAENGDATQQAWLMSFFETGDGASAAFATGGPSLALEFSPLVVLDPIPEPTSLVLLGTGLLAKLAIRRRRASKSA